MDIIKLTQIGLEKVSSSGGSASDTTYDNTDSGLTATTVQDAIDEVVASSVSGAAEDITYDNTSSGLTATDVQAAIDEVVASSVSGAAEDITYDNTTSGLIATDVQAAIDEVDGNVDDVTTTVASHTTTLNTMSTTLANVTDTDGVVTSDLVTQVVANTSRISTIESSINDEVSEFNMLDGVSITEDEIINASGTAQAMSSSLTYCHTDYIAVEAGVTYICHCYAVALYDSSKTFLSSTSLGAQLQEFTPTASGYCIISFGSKDLSFTKLCKKENMYKTLSGVFGKSSIWYDLNKGGDVELYGDSNSVGYGLSDTTQSWANLLGTKITGLGEYIYCYPTECSVFCQTVYSGQPKLFNNGGTIYFTAYTDEMQVNFSYITTVNVEIDGVAVDDMTATGQVYTFDSIGLHTIKLTGASGQNVFTNIRIKRSRTFTNNAITGTNSSKLSAYTPPTNGIALVMYGTNDRGLNSGMTTRNLVNFIKSAYDVDCDVYIFTPIPTTSSGETDSSYTKDLSQVIAEMPNVNLINVYEPMQLAIILSSSTLYNDALHLNAAGHKVLYAIAASKLQLAAFASEIE